MKNSFWKWALGLLIIGAVVGPRLRENNAQTQPMPAAKWLTSYDEALKTAHETGKPILIDFQATWCGPCHKLHDEVFAAPIFKPEASRWVLLSVDVDEQQKLAIKYGVTSLPTLLALNSQGKPVLYTKGYSDPQSTLEYLRAAYAKATG